MRLICFDLDNTLINSDKSHSTAYNNALKELGYNKQKEEYIASLFGRPKEDVVKQILPKGTKRERDKLLKKYYSNLRKTFNFCKKIPGVTVALKNLKKNYHIAILSNSKHFDIHLLLQGAKIEIGLFDLIIGNDDVKHSKPYPDEILKAEKLLHHKAEYMVGDSIYDIRAGKKAKVKTIAVLTGNYSRKTLQKEHPDYIIKSVKDISKIIN